jgi:hypothetical protein
MEIKRIIWTGSIVGIPYSVSVYMLFFDERPVVCTRNISYSPHIPQVHMGYKIQLHLMEMGCATYKLVCNSMLYITYML